MNDVFVTLQGWVGSEVVYREAGAGWVASFRVGSTPRMFRDGVFRDGETAWFTVNAWRNLGRNVSESVQVGDAVVVHGRLRADVWEREEEQTSIAHVVDAAFVGHDLGKGTSTFLKTPRRDSQGPADDSVLKELNHGYAEGPQLTSDGEPVGPPAA